MFVTFHRAVCPDGFSLDFDKYIGLDPIGTTGLATKVDHGYLQAFAAAAAVGGLGGLAQIGNNGSVLSPSTEIRNGISEQSADRRRTGPESLPESPARHHAQGRLPRPRVHRHGHSDSVLRGTSRRSHPVSMSFLDEHHEERRLKVKVCHTALALRSGSDTDTALSATNPNPSGVPMKFNLKNRKKYLIAGGLLLPTATPSFALFGIGDIVFDPTSYASLVSQLTTLSTSTTCSRTTSRTSRSSSSGRRRSHALKT